MQVQITLGTNTKRTKIVVDNSMTPKQILTDNNIDYGTAQLNLDGSTLTREELNMPLSAIIGETTDQAMLIAVVKTDNAQ